MLLKSTEMNVQFMQMFKERSKRSACCHLGERIHVLREALATISKLAIRTGNVCMRVVDITGEQNAIMDIGPIDVHVLAVVVYGIEVSNLVGTENIVAIFRDFRFERRHYGKFASLEYF